MRLNELLQSLDSPSVYPKERSLNLASIEVSAVTRDSRESGGGVVYVAIAGSQVDGHTFAPSVQGGVVISERQVDLNPNVVGIQVRDSRLALAQVAAAIYGRPAESVPVVGITGTNGKTTVSTICAGAMDALGLNAGRVGTLGAFWGGQERPSALTTPEAPQLQGFLAEMRNDGVLAAFIEASSIALEQRRLEALPFHAVVFTNLTRDHLDFHGDMDAYVSAKAMLFEPARLRPAGGLPRALVCGDDAAWKRLGVPEDHWKYGFAEDNDIRILSTRPAGGGQRLEVRLPGGEQIEVTTKLVGRFNALNVVAALGVLQLVGVGWKEAARGIRAVRGVPGRLQRVEPPSGWLDFPEVFVDYAHTPDALESAISAVRPLSSGTLTVVFGCGGDRDHGKRPQMGEVALRLADRVIVTSDNPRKEDPLAIIDDIIAGLDPAEMERVQVDPDRRSAICLALESQRDGVVLIAGKGHETYQEIDGKRMEFDDVAVARGALSMLGELQEEAIELKKEGVESPASFLPNFDAATVALATGGEVLANGGHGPILTDTRKDLSGAWFLALQGANFDGHQYLEQAKAGGIVGAIVHRIPDGFEVDAWGLGLVLVGDTTQAMGELGYFCAANESRPIIAITGSSGKTTTRALTACALAGTGLNVHQTVGNLNNHLGVPMTLLATPPEADVLVVEMGTSAPGEIRHLAEVATPTHRLIVNVGPAHLEELGGLDGVAVEKGALFDTARPGDTILVNLDDSRLRSWARRAPPGVNVLTWGQDPGADVRLVDVFLSPKTMTTTAVIDTIHGEFEARLPLFGHHAAADATGALAIAMALGRDVNAAIDGLAQYQPVGMRQRVESLPSGAMVINDAYNANPDSMKSALRTLAALGGQSVAALGDMLELGTDELRLHREVLTFAAEQGITRILVVGRRMMTAAAGLDVEVFPSPEAAGQALVGTLSSEHRLLVKGSRGVAMERILQSLQSET